MSPRPSVPPSVLAAAPSGASLVLTTGPAATPGGPVAAPLLLRAAAVRPGVLVAGLLALLDVVTTSYAWSGRGSAGTTGALVATATPGLLRLEALSRCRGVHARLDVLPGALTRLGADGPVDGATAVVGVDDGLRAALTALGDGPLVLAVGGAPTAPSGPPPAAPGPAARDVRALAEASSTAAAGVPVLDVGPRDAATFLGRLPQRPPGPSVGVLATPRGVAVAGPTTPGAVPLVGSGRLAAARRVARHVVRLRGWRCPAGAGAWTADLPDLRLTVVVSPTPDRGFSGEGSLLGTRAEDDADGAVPGGLAWNPAVDPARSTASLRPLLVAGALGWDLHAGRWFHRELPGATPEDTPRERRAARLVAEDRVLPAPGGDGRRWEVSGPRATHRVDLADGSCSCRWYALHGDERGACAHVLAVRRRAAADGAG